MVSVILLSIICLLLLFISSLLVFVNRNISSYLTMFMMVNETNMKAIGTNFEIVQSLLDEQITGKGGKFEDDLDRNMKQTFERFKKKR